jgi:hypothetical protein
MEYKVAKYVNYQSNKNLIQEIMDLIKPSYQTAGKHVAKDIEICNELYIVQDENSLILAFFMVGYHQIDGIECCYLGLSTCREEYKNRGYSKSLFNAFAYDCIRQELALNKRIICYWTTATPIIYHWFTKNFWNVQPDRKGNCTAEGKAMLLHLGNAKYPHKNLDPENPFVLRQAAHQINYSDSERERIKKAVNDLNLTVFDTHKLDETNGDRFLMFGYTPSHDKLIERHIVEN